MPRRNRRNTKRSRRSSKNTRKPTRRSAGTRPTKRPPPSKGRRGGRRSPRKPAKGRKRGERASGPPSTRSCKARKVRKVRKPRPLKPLKRNPRDPQFLGNENYETHRGYYYMRRRRWVTPDGRRFATAKRAEAYNKKRHRRVTIIDTTNALREVGLKVRYSDVAGMDRDDIEDAYTDSGGDPADMESWGESKGEQKA